MPSALRQALIVCATTDSVASVRSAATHRRVAGLQAGYGSHIVSAAKAAVIQLTRTVAVELGESGVRLIMVGEGTGTPTRIPIRDQAGTLVEYKIDEGGQVVRTDVKSVNRYSSGARGVIVMRLKDGDSVAGIAVFRRSLFTPVAWRSSRTTLAALASARRRRA